MPAPTAMPKNGMKNSIPNRRPQNIPHVAPPPADGAWVVVNVDTCPRCRG